MTSETIQQNVESTTTPDSASADPVSEISNLMDQALSGENSTSNDGDDKPEANAPETGNPEEEAPKAPVVEEPAEKKGEAAEDEAEPAKTTEEDTSLEDDLLGVNPKEKQTDDIVVLKSRYSEATRRIGELSDQRKAIDAVLASAGRMIVNTKDGPKLVPIEGAEQVNIESIGLDHNGIYKSLTAEERDMLTDDPEKAVKAIAEKAAKQVAEKLVPAQASRNDSILTQQEIDGVFDEFVSSKLADGKTPRFPDANAPQVMDLMGKAYNANTPAMEKLKEAALHDRDMSYILHEYLYLKAFRAQQAKMAVSAANKKATEDKKEKITKEVKVSSSGASIPAMAQTQRAQTDESARLGSVLDGVLA